MALFLVTSVHIKCAHDARNAAVTEICEHEVKETSASFLFGMAVSNVADKGILMLASLSVRATRSPKSSNSCAEYCLINGA